MSLTAVSPIDGRYASKTSALQAYFSEQALIQYRLRVEVEYFIALCKLPLPQLEGVDHSIFPALRAIYTDFAQADALAIKEIERTTNHDVKAVEYFLKQEFDRLGLSAYKEFIHFGLTSQDINNTAIPLSIKEAVEKVYLPNLETLVQKIETLATEWKAIAMLARTHGQPASPTRLGKELKVFAVRLREQIASFSTIKYAAKFVEEVLGLYHSFPTTQIEHYDHVAALFDLMKRINTILIDFNRDIWTYISMDYFKQRIKAGEVGSSAMPHKVNPIDFENSEGNLGIANALLEHLAAKLPISRLQRDLTDSTVLRNVGVPFAHTLIAIASTLKGLDKLILNADKLQADLDDNWAVVAEAIQTILRREGYPNPYEALKGLTRTNEKINQQTLHVFINTLEVSDTLKAELKAITPANYTGEDYME